MTRPNVSLAFLTAAKAQESADPVAVLVTIEHDDLPAPLRLNNAGANLVSRGETYLACFLQPVILDDDPDRPPRAQLLVSNVQREMVAALRSTLVPPQVTLEVVRTADPDYVEASMTNLELRNVDGDALVLQGDLTPRKIRPQPFGDYCYTPSYFPGLF